MRSLGRLLERRFCTLAKPQLSKEEWDAKEKEWRETAIRRNQEQLDYLNNKLTADQKRKIELVAQACLELDKFEFQSLFLKINQDTQSAFGVSLANIQPEWPVVKAQDYSNIKTQEELDVAIKQLMEGRGAAEFGQLFSGSGSGGAVGGGQATQPAQQGGKAEAKKEEKAAAAAEKTNFDIELSGYDAAKKILITKEVRALFNLGLKEAKDLVDKAPCTLSKGVKKEDAQSLKEKLEALGCKINLL